MKITLTQSEIEAAITNFITNQIAVRPEMRIDIELAATRGEDGFTAMIDIVHKNSPRTTKDGKKVIPVSLVPEEEPTKQEVVKAEEVPEARPPKEEEPAPTPPVALETPVQVNPLAQPAAERPRSLFAGLQKPTNP